MLLSMTLALLLASVSAILEVIITQKSTSSVILSYLTLHKVELISSNNTDAPHEETNPLLNFVKS